LPVQQQGSVRSPNVSTEPEKLFGPQKFAEELFKRLNKSAAERFEVRLVMMSVISRVTGVHKLLLLNFYPFLQKYVLPHQRDAPTLLAVLVQVSLPPTTPPPTLSTVLFQ
jgi:protein SDA1